MKTSIAFSARHCLCALLLLSAAAWADPDPPETQPRRFPAWFPSSAHAGPQAGLGFARFRASSEYRALVEPVPSEGPWMAPSWGGVVSLRWQSGFSLSLSPRRETYGLRTETATVSFRGNPYPHTLEARTRLDYNLYPILSGFGWYPAGQHLQIQIGVYRAFLDQERVEWTVDGEPYDQRPGFTSEPYLDGWLLALEYGVALGRGEIILGFESGRAFGSALYGLKGGLRPDAAQIRLGYSWILWRRLPGR